MALKEWWAWEELDEWDGWGKWNCKKCNVNVGRWNESSYCYKCVYEHLMSPVIEEIDKTAFNSGLKFGKSIKVFGGVDIDSIMSVLKERMGKSNYEEWCNIRSKIENKGDVKTMKFNINVGDLVFWYQDSWKQVFYGKVKMIEENQLAVEYSSPGSALFLLDCKSVLFMIPKDIKIERLSLIDSIVNILQQQFDRKEEVNEPQEPEIKLYPFQEKIYNEIINCNSVGNSETGRKYLFIEMPPRTGKTTLIKKLNEYFNYRYRMNLSYNTLFKHLGVYDNKEKSSIALIDDMQKTLVDTTEEINRSVLQTADCIKKYTTDNALIVFIGGRFGINDYTSVMRSHIVNQVANGNPFSLLVKKYPAWENSASQCSPMLDYKTLKGIKEQIGEEMFSVMYLLKV